MSKFDEELLESKRKRFYETVYKICRKRNLPMPSINFNGCPYEDEDQLAHYHSQTNTICVSKTQLIKLNYDDIYHVASHETAHILQQNHEPEFDKEQEKNRQEGWEPPPGTIHITGGGKVSKGKEKKSKTDKTRCNYHLCRKKTKLKQCKYCKGYFCKEHIKAKPPAMPPFKSNSPEVQSMMEEWRKPGGHPCPECLVDWKKEIKSKDDKYKEALERLLKLKFKEDKISSNEDIFEEIWETNLTNFPTKKKEDKKEDKKEEVFQDIDDFIEDETKKYFSLGKIIMIILVFVLIGVLAYKFYVPMVSFCSDNVKINECLEEKPLYCEYKGLLNKPEIIENPNYCGCPEGKRVYQDGCIKLVECNDGTLYPECSRDKPFICREDGSLRRAASICGCPEGHTADGDWCDKIN